MIDEPTKPCECGMKMIMKQIGHDEVEWWCLGCGTIFWEAIFGLVRTPQDRWDAANKSE